MSLPLNLDSGFWNLDSGKSIIYHLKSKIWRHKLPGFTLIEILVAITIISILLAAATASYTSAQKKGRDGKRKVDLKAVQQALELYFQTNGKYPAGSTGSIQCNAGADTTTLTWGTSTFTCNSITFMDKLPKDPKDQSTNGYYFTSSGSPPTSYVISALLENTNDSDIAASSGCQLGRNYCVKNP